MSESKEMVIILTGASRGKTNPPIFHTEMDLVAALLKSSLSTPNSQRFVPKHVLQIVSC
jgi:hypothetical protein